MTNIFREDRKNACINKIKERGCCILDNKNFRVFENMETNKHGFEITNGRTLKCIENLTKEEAINQLILEIKNA